MAEEKKSYYAEHREEMNAYYRKYYKNPVNKMKAKAKNKKYYEEHKEEIKAKRKAKMEQIPAEERRQAARDYYKENSVVIKKRNAEYYKKHKKKYKEYQKLYQKDYQKLYYEENKEELIAKKVLRERIKEVEQDLKADIMKKQQTLCIELFKHISEERYHAELTDDEKLLIGYYLVDEDLTACEMLKIVIGTLDQNARKRMYRVLALSQKQWEDFRPVGDQSKWLRYSRKKYEALRTIADNYFTDKGEKRYDTQSF